MCALAYTESFNLIKYVLITKSKSSRLMNSQNLITMTIVDLSLFIENTQTMCERN